MAYGDGEALTLDAIYRVTGVGANLVLNRAAEDGGSAVGLGEDAKGIPDLGQITIASTNDARQPVADGPERYRVVIMRIR